MSNIGVNEVTLIGYLGSKPKFTSEENNFATVNLCVHESWKDKTTGEIKEQETWIGLTLSGHTAQFSTSYLDKGSKVFVKGCLRLNQWIDAKNQPQSKLRVKVQSIMSLNERKLEDAPETLENSMQSFNELDKENKENKKSKKSKNNKK